MTKKTIQQFGLVTVIILRLTVFPQPVLAGVMLSGNIDPADPMTWTSATDGYIGKTADGTMEINEGSVVTDSRGYIGNDDVATGEVTVHGINSTWTNSTQLYIGNYGNGVLDITDGGTVSNTTAFVAYRSNSTGYVTVDGLDSQWDNGTLYAGRDGNGTLNIKNGGTVSCTGTSNIGYGSGSMGTVTVNGINSTWAHTSSSSGIYVGYYGNGTLNISGGAMVSVRDAWVSRYDSSTSKVIVDGSGSTWNVNVPGGQGQVAIGFLGNGTLEITNGGAVNNKYGYIGSSANSTGKVTVSGPDSSWTCSSFLRVGNYGNGTMIIKNGAFVTNELECYIGAELGTTGTVAVVGPGSTWTCNDPLHVGRNGSGTLTITNGGLVSVDNGLTIDTDGDGDGFVYMTSGGQLAIEGNGSGSITAFLALINGTDALKYWDGTNWYGISDAINGVDYTLEYLTTGNLAGYTMLTVHAPGPPDPDIDGNGEVDMQDVASLASQWLDDSCMGPDWCGRADVDYSGDVGFSDLQTLIENWLDGVE